MWEQGISTLAPREGSDATGKHRCDALAYFYPRSPRGERLQFVQNQGQAVHISTLAPREGSDLAGLGTAPQVDISTLAPREGSDFPAPAVRVDAKDFYPRSPRGERQYKDATLGIDELFLPSLPARGATRLSALTNRNTTYFYPRSPRGERRHWKTPLRHSCIFLPSLPARGATRYGQQMTWPQVFLPSLPARGATGFDRTQWYALDISTLAPREGSDGMYRVGTDIPAGISTLAPREGSDLRPSAGHFQTRHFYPRSPRGERRAGQHVRAWRWYFYPRSPRGERPRPRGAQAPQYTISTLAPREGSDRKTM